MMGMDQPSGTVGIPYHRAQSKGFDVDYDQSRGSFMDQIRRALKKAFSSGDTSSPSNRQQGEFYASQVSSSYATVSRRVDQQEADSLGSNSTEAPPCEDHAAAMVVILQDLWTTLCI